MPGETFDVTGPVFAQMTWRYGSCQCRFCKEKLKVGDRVVPMRRISQKTAWFRKYIHESCWEKSLGSFVPLFLEKPPLNVAHG